MISERAKEKGVLVFAGAGISMPPPSALPNWYQFNEAVLTALADEVSSYTKPNIAEWILSGLVERRNKTPYFAPDYMADVIAEEVGMEYFKVVQALDAEETNACHRSIAALAQAGVLRAVVTTNFDRLLERAFEQAGIAYRVYATQERFAELKTLLEENPPASGDSVQIAIVKVHGTVEDLNSMVDTMSQRLAGRPQELQEALSLLYARHHLLFLGFSGADLDYDPNYLGLHGAAQHNQGFTFLRRSGDKPRKSVEGLRDAWGEGAAIVEGLLPDWIVQLARHFGLSVELPPSANLPVNRLEVVRERAGAWAKTLGPLQNVNILSSLLRASGDDPTAGRLFWGMWRHYRMPEDMKGVSYARLNHLIGRFLLEYGFNLGSLRPATSVRLVSGDIPPELDRDLMDNAFQYLARAVNMGHTQSYVDLAACYALMGKCKDSIELLQKVLDVAVEQRHLLLVIDCAIAGGLVWSMAGMWSHGLPYLELAREAAIRLGMEPRRARLCVHLTRFLAWKERPDDALDHYREGSGIAERLGMEATQMELHGAAGYALTEQGRAAEAVSLLLTVCDYFQQSGRMASLTRAALDLRLAAMQAGDQAAFDKAGEILQEYEHGYKPHVYALNFDIGLRFDDLDYARRNLENLKQAADECENEWAKLVAQASEEALIAREQASGG